MELWIQPEHVAYCKKLYVDRLTTHNAKVTTFLVGDDYADSGFDLYIPWNSEHDKGKWVFPPNSTVLIPMGVKIVNRLSVEGARTLPYYIYARSSISKTPLRLANNQGIIDAGYRGELMIALDNTLSKPLELDPGTRLVQVCAPNLIPFKMELVENDFETTERGSGGFGSTGN